MPPTPSPPRVIFLLHPDSALLERSGRLPEHPELDLAGADPAGLGGDDDVSRPFLEDKATQQSSLDRVKSTWKSLKINTAKDKKRGKAGL